jgi:PAS domain-containing protein
MLRVLDSFTPELDWRLLAAVCLVFLLAGIALIVRFRRSQTGRLSDKGQLLELALNNMTQGVVMFDAKARLVVCNDRYLEIYDLPPNIVKPGARLADIVRLRARSGSLPDDPDKYVAELMEIIAAGKVVSFVSELPDGRSIAVVNRAIPGGSYWIGTHHDITERRKVEQKNALLGARKRAAPSSKRPSPGSAKASKSS